MTRDEVLERLEEKIQSSEFFQIEVFDIQFLRAAAELIRQGGWRPIAEAPEEAGLFLGAHDAMGVWLSYGPAQKDFAIRHGFTHYLPEPEPPAREVPNE